MVALAAGHRPCGECRRKYYRDYIGAANVDSDNPIAGSGDLDRHLRVSRRAERTTPPVDSLPDGAFIRPYKWSPVGYVEPIAIADSGVTEAIVITPALSVRALRHGYPVTVHSSFAPAAPVPAVPESSLARRVRAQPAPVTWAQTAGGLSEGHRAEVEQILRASSPGLTHGEVFRYLEQGNRARHQVGSTHERICVQGVAQPSTASQEAPCACCHLVHTRASAIDTDVLCQALAPPSQPHMTKPYPQTPKRIVLASHFRAAPRIAIQAQWPTSSLDRSANEP